MLQNESSHSVTENRAECSDSDHIREGAASRQVRSVGSVPETSDEALRLAVKLAVDEEDYTRVETLLDLLRRPKPTQLPR